MGRTDRFIRITLLTMAALAALLFARQGRDDKAIAGIVCLLAVATAVATDPARLATRRWIPGTGRLITLWLLALVPLAGYAIMQKTGHDPIDEMAKFHSADRPFATFGNPDFFGAFLAFLVPVLWGLTASRPPESGPRPWSAAFVAVMLLWTGSRGAWLGAIVGCGVFAAQTITRSNIRQIKTLAGWWRIAFFVLLVGLALVTRVYPLVRQAYHRRTDRLMLWEGTARMIQVHPVAGWGPGKFASEYPPFAPPAFAQRMKDDNTFAEHPHSEYLHLWVETGALGLGLFLWIVAAILSQGFVSARAGQPLAAGAVGGLVAILVHIAVDRNFRLASTAVPFWLTAASLWAMPRATAFPGSVRRFPFPIPALLITALLVLGAYSLRPLAASIRVEHEGDFLKQAADVPAADLERRGAAMKGDPQYWIALGNAWAKEKNFMKAAASFRGALALDPALTSAANNLGNCWFMMSRFEEAGAVYRGMLVRDPQHKDARFNLAFTYFHQRRIKEALAELAILLRQDPTNAKALALRAQLSP